jgi:CMP-N-acetylneuraminic acid synthetase
MFLNKKIIGLIPARSGSKGIKNKNMQKIGKNSLIGHAVTFINSLNLLDYKLISTDSKLYIEEAKRFGLNNYLLRSKNLSSDNASIIDVINNAIKFAEKKNKLYFDYLLLIEPTSPFRLKTDILK